MSEYSTDELEDKTWGDTFGQTDGVPISGEPTSMLAPRKRDIPGLLRGLAATQRGAGMPEVPIAALGRFIGVHRRTLYKLMDGEPCSDALAGRLRYVLARIYRGELVFEQGPDRQWQGRYVRRGEVPPKPQQKVHACKIEFTATGPVLRLLRLT